jgi:hypothetical protein
MVLQALSLLLLAPLVSAEAGVVEAEAAEEETGLMLELILEVGDGADTRITGDELARAPTADTTTDCILADRPVDPPVRTVTAPLDTDEVPVGEVAAPAAVPASSIATAAAAEEAGEAVAVAVDVAGESHIMAGTDKLAAGWDLKPEEEAVEGSIITGVPAVVRGDRARLAAAAATGVLLAEAAAATGAGAREGEGEASRLKEAGSCWGSCRLCISGLRGLLLLLHSGRAWRRTVAEEGAAADTAEAGEAAELFFEALNVALTADPEAASATLGGAMSRICSVAPDWPCSCGASSVAATEELLRKENTCALVVAVPNFCADFKAPFCLGVRGVPAPLLLLLLAVRGAVGLMVTLLLVEAVGLAKELELAMVLMLPLLLLLFG